MKPFCVLLFALVCVPAFGQFLADPGQCYIDPVTGQQVCPNRIQPVKAAVKVVEATASAVVDRLEAPKHSFSQPRSSVKSGGSCGQFLSTPSYGSTGSGWYSSQSYGSTGSANYGSTGSSSVAQTVTGSYGSSGSSAVASSVMRSEPSSARSLAGTIAETGVVQHDPSYAGRENVYWSSSAVLPRLQARVAWWQSPGHRANLPMVGLRVERGESGVAVVGRRR